MRNKRLLILSALCIVFFWAAIMQVSTVDSVYAQSRTAELSKNKLKKLEQSVLRLQTMMDFNYKTVDYASMISYVVNIENPRIAESAPVVSEGEYSACSKIKKKRIDTYLKKKFHLKKPKKKILSTYSGYISVKEVKGFYYVLRASGEVGVTPKIISVKKREGKKYEVLYDRFTEEAFLPAGVDFYDTYIDTAKAIVSYSSELKTWTFYKVISKGKLSGYPKKNYINTGLDRKW